MAVSGLHTLHAIDQAIAKARANVGEASVLPSRTSAALVDVQRQQALAYSEIASERLALIEAGGGGDLGYVDRQAAKLLEAHEGDEAQLSAQIDNSIAQIERLESERRSFEDAAHKAVDLYDKAAAAAEAKILKDPDYAAQVAEVGSAESTRARALQKLELAREDEQKKGEPYRADKFFNYLSERRYGTREAKGWFLTRLLDGWVARKIDYRQAAENYRRLTAIPVRLENHVTRLDARAAEAKARLHEVEAQFLKREGVTGAHEASLEAQNALEAIDAKIAAAEAQHQALRTQQADLAAGRVGPQRDALELMAETLKTRDVSSLRRLAAQTRTLDDDRAIDEIVRLAGLASDLQKDQRKASELLEKFQRTLAELEAVRRRFKDSRYDAPSSTFERGDLLGAFLGQVLAGLLSSDDFWRQIQRAQRTVRRYSDSDFGGGDWTGGLRLPRGDGGFGGGFGGGSWPSGGGSWPSGGGFGGSRRTSIPRSPRQSLPRMPSGGGGRGGGFKTGGGF